MPLDASTDPRRLLGQTPIPGDAPAGASVRDSQEFEELEAQIHILERSGPTAVDWTIVIERSTRILETQSKDLLVAAYLTFALWRRTSLAGLATGLIILSDIVTLYWDTAEPPARRIRGRVSIFEWLTGRLGPILATELADLPAGPEATLGRDALYAIDTVLNDKLGPAAPSLGDLLRPLRSLAEKAEAEAAAAAAKAEAEAENAAASAAAAAAATAPAATAPAAVVAAGANATPAASQQAVSPTADTRPATSAAPGPAISVPAAPAASPDMERAVFAGRAWLRSFALALLAADLRDHRGWVLLAEATWLFVTALPPNRGGQTELPKPRDEQLNDLLSRRSNPRAFVTSATQYCSGEGLFWLEGQYLISQALSALGPDMSEAVASHGRAVALALTPLKGLPGLSYSDGTPFMSDAGRDWLQAQSASGGESGGGGAMDLPWKQGAARAEELLGLSKPEEAYDCLAKGAAASQGEARARWLFEALRLAVRTKDAAFGLALARRLTALVRDHHLAEWSPEFAADILEHAIRCLMLQEAAYAFPFAERQTLLSEWSIELSALAVGRARDALKTPLPTS
jgi:type VI secretion system protein VasJ